MPVITRSLDRAVLTLVWVGCLLFVGGCIMAGCRVHQDVSIPPDTIFRLTKPMLGAHVAVYDHTGSDGVDVYRELTGTVTLPAFDYVMPPPTLTVPATLPVH